MCCTFSLYEIYAASLTSVFTVDVFVSPVNSLQDALAGGYQINVWTGTVLEQYFKARNLDVLEKNNKHKALLSFSDLYSQDAEPGTVEKEIWDTIIKDTPNQVPDVSTGLTNVYENEKVRGAQTFIVLLLSLE